MPNRRKPFSSKQKKQQMMEKRERKKQDDAEDSDDGTDSGQEPAAILHASAKERIPVPVNKVNQQPGSANDKAFHQASREVREYDPNRYRLHFYRESKVSAFCSYALLVPLVRFGSFTLAMLSTLMSRHLIV